MYELTITLLFMNDKDVRICNYIFFHQFIVLHHCIVNHFIVFDLALKNSLSTPIENSSAHLRDVAWLTNNERYKITDWMKHLEFA